MPSEKEEDAKAKLVRVSGIRLTSTVGVLATGYSTLDWIGRGKKNKRTFNEASSTPESLMADLMSSEADPWWSLSRLEEVACSRYRVVVGCKSVLGD